MISEYKRPLEDTLWCCRAGGARRIRRSTVACRLLRHARLTVSHQERKLAGKPRAILLHFRLRRTASRRCRGTAFFERTDPLLGPRPLAAEGRPIKDVVPQGPMLGPLGHRNERERVRERALRDAGGSYCSSALERRRLLSRSRRAALAREVCDLARLPATKARRHNRSAPPPFLPTRAPHAVVRAPRRTPGLHCRDAA